MNQWLAQLAAQWRNNGEISESYALAWLAANLYAKSNSVHGVMALAAYVRLNNNGVAENNCNGVMSMASIIRNICGVMNGVAS